LIGVLCRPFEKPAVSEFFELFKTPWEFHKAGSSYDVIMTSVDPTPDLEARLLLFFSSHPTDFDRRERLLVLDHLPEARLKIRNQTVPVYGPCLTFRPTRNAILPLDEGSGTAGVVLQEPERKVLRLGFDLFREVEYLLTTGQPSALASTPTLDLHIARLREWIVCEGIPLTEIPPAPAGYDFVCCLTHDVDFVGFRRHRLDHTMLGFLYRATIGSVRDAFTGKKSLKQLLRNLGTVLTLPAVYLDLADDFWVQFDRYREIEDGLPSTFFFIPQKDDAGSALSDKPSPKRAARYDAQEVERELKRLVASGHEISVHGIDAWCDQEKGKQERLRVAEAAGTDVHGIRMHWLYMDADSAGRLESAGFQYDSSRGYNDSVGYHAGTAQAFRPLGTDSILELPLTVQDTALFYPGRMSLDPEQAWTLTQDLIANARHHGGALTVNWHHRSIAPERLWDDFYVRLLAALKSQAVWFATARDAANWFSRRRQWDFHASTRENLTHLAQSAGPGDEASPPLLLRTYLPTAGEATVSSEERTAFTGHESPLVYQDRHLSFTNPL
jgi:hypothetical protein